MTTNIEVINLATFEEQYGDKVGSLLFPDEWYDCEKYVDKVKLRMNIKDKLPNGVRIVKVLIPVDTSPRFKNIANRLVPYKNPLCASKEQDGAYYKTYPEINFAMYASDFPVGDAIVVYK